MLFANLSKYVIILFSFKKRYNGAFTLSLDARISVPGTKNNSVPVYTKILVGLVLKDLSDVKRPPKRNAIISAE